MRTTLNNKKYLWCSLLALLCIIMASCKHKTNAGITGSVPVTKQIYTCSMHPQIMKDMPGQCPICGMDLIKKEENAQKINDIQLNDILKPANGFLPSSLPVTTMERRVENITIEAIGNVQNDTRSETTISTRVTGRIVKLYIRYRYQMIMPGDKIMDIYSPEIATAQQNLLFLLKNDAQNISLISSAKQRLLSMGMSNQQVQQLVRMKKASLTITIYSNVVGHVHEAGQEGMNTIAPMQSSPTATEPLAIREGMYVQSGQRIFTVTNPAKAWVLLNIFPENQHLIKVGYAVKVIPEAMPQKTFTARISFIEPFYREGSKTLTARVYFNNFNLHIPIGSQVRANIITGTPSATWLPQDAVISLGLNSIAFVKMGSGFVARKVQTGLRVHNSIQIINGLAATDTVASNAQYLTDSESFIKVK